MSRQKKLFALLAGVFVILLIFVSYDISRRTTFPGSKPQLMERIRKEPVRDDSLDRDTTRAIRPNPEMP